MLEQDLKLVRQLITHEGCADGVASSMIIQDVLPYAEVKFVTQGRKPYLELPANPGMLFCDIVPPPNRIAEFVQAGAIVLDHHKGVEEIVAAFGKRGAFADERKRPGVSGAGLAWEEVWSPLKGQARTSPEEVLNFQKMIGIVDTWQRTFPFWDHACCEYAVLTFHPVDYWLGKNGYKPHLACLTPEERELGKTLMVRHNIQVQNAIQNAYRFERGGLKYAIFQGEKVVVSDAAELLRQEGIDLVAGFRFICENDRPKMVFSIRTSENINAAKFAQAFDGNGHSRSAGFSLDLLEDDPNPYLLFRALIYIYAVAGDNYEGNIGKAFLARAVQDPSIGHLQAREGHQQFQEEFPAHDTMPDDHLIRITSDVSKLFKKGKAN